MKESDLYNTDIETDATHTKVVAGTTLPTASAAKNDTIYVMRTASANYNSANDISSSNYPAGTMFTATVSGTGANATVTFTQYNV